MGEIRIVYIDDDLDTNISKYLASEYQPDDFNKVYSEVCFKSEFGYEMLINDKVVKEANIIIVDSKLFENDRVSTGKFSGEEFKMILKKIFPFIEVVVITQNEFEENYGTISKYRSCFGGSAQDYYASNLKKALDDAILNIEIYRNIANKLKLNDGIDRVLIEKIMSSLEGNSIYEELTKRDIDEIIVAFKEIQRSIDD